MMNVDGVAVAYTDRGRGKPILFLHGNPDSRHSWEPLFDAMGDGYRFVAPDFPGFGDSKPLPPEFELGPTSMSEFWNRFVDGLGLEGPVNVVVHDFGGPWLLPWVASYPDKVRSLFALNTVFHRSYSWHSWARIWQTPVLGELAMLLSRRFVLRREMRQHAPGVPVEWVDEAYARMHRTMKRTVLRTYRAYAEPAAVFASWEEKLIEAVKEMPVCVVWGDLDPYIPSAFADRFGVEAVHLTDYGHWAHLQAPKVVAGLLREFLEKANPRLA